MEMAQQFITDLAMPGMEEDYVPDRGSMKYFFWIIAVRYNIWTGMINKMDALGNCMIPLSNYLPRYRYESFQVILPLQVHTVWSHGSENFSTLA